MPPDSLLHGRKRWRKRQPSRCGIQNFSLPCGNRTGFYRDPSAPSLMQICKLDTLRLESGSFIEDDLRPFYSDILYSLETTSGCGYVHVLIEHQSSPDKLMAFRLMRYAIAAMQRHIEEGHKTLPLVIPILFIRDGEAPIPGRWTGWRTLPIRILRARFTPPPFRWWTSPLFPMTKSWSTGVWRP